MKLAKQLVCCLVYGAILGIIFYWIGIANANPACNWGCHRPEGELCPGQKELMQKRTNKWAKENLSGTATTIIGGNTELLPNSLIITSGSGSIVIDCKTGKIILNNTTLDEASMEFWNKISNAFPAFKEEIIEEYKSSLNKKTTINICYIGQKVWTINAGWGEIVSVTDKVSRLYPIRVKTKIGSYTYNKEGKRFYSDIIPSLYTEEMKVVPVRVETVVKKSDGYFSVDDHVCFNDNAIKLIGSDKNFCGKIVDIIANTYTLSGKQYVVESCKDKQTKIIDIAWLKKSESCKYCRGKSDKERYKP